MSEGTAALQQPVPAAPAPIEEEERPAGAFSLRNIVRLLLASGSGRAGIALFLFMVALSIYVVVAFPRDFGNSRWSNPTYWADNPKAVPPKWTAWLGKDAVTHQRYAISTPTQETPRGTGEIREYDIPIHYDANVAPTLLTVTFTGVTYDAADPRSPSFIVSLLRPDGGRIALASVQVPGPRPGESGEIRRYYDTPNRIVLTQQDTAAKFLSQWFQQQYPNLPVPADLANQLNQGLFAAPAADGSGRLVPLHGDYTLVVQAALPNVNSQVAPVKAVLGGTVYGWMGTDALGRNLIEGLIYGFPVALLIATLASFLSTLIGASLGILSGYAGGVTDSVIQRLVDIISNVPVLPLLIFLVFILGSHLYLIILVLVAFSWTGLTILVRSMVLQIRAGQLVEAAKALGASRRRIMFRHVFPQTAPFIVAQMIFFAPGAILAEASLSFLGLGDPSVPTWGQMLQAGFQTGALYVGYWWWVIPPGVLIIFTALAFMLLALAMEPIVDPRLRSVQ
jgi:peptide/nickel transport system permease protein